MVDVWISSRFFVVYNVSINICIFLMHILCDFFSGVYLRVYMIKMTFKTIYITMHTACREAVILIKLIL